VRQIQAFTRRSGNDLHAIPRSARSLTRPVIAGLLALTAAVPAACGAPNDAGVVTLESNAPSVAELAVQREAEQVEGAEALLACLQDADLPAALTPLDKGARVGWQSQGHDIMARYPDGYFVPVPGKAGEFAQETIEAFELAHPDGYGLEVDGVDRTAPFAACHERSAYVDPTELDADPASELALHQRQADATNAWIACARQNGLPELADVTAAADGGPPEALIPLTVRAAELEGARCGHNAPHVAHWPHLGPMA
jgi:hypothetical protein